MIGRLQGILLSKGDSEVLLDVNGVGYEVEVPSSSLYQLPETGSTVVLHTHFVVREDAQHLYGFFELRDRSLFRLLIKVNGVGPRLALGVLAAMESSRFVASVVRDDVNALVKLPGVGRKTAERLIIELRDKLKAWELDHGTAVQPAVAAGPGRKDNLHEAENALISLGYKPQEASRAVVLAASQLDSDATESATTEQLIRSALKNLARAAS